MPRITQAHDERVRALDPAIAPAGAELDEDAPGYLAAIAGDGRAEAIAGFEAVDPATIDAVWGALRRHTLELRSAGEDADRIAAVERVLDAWLERIAETETPGDFDSSARISLPTRDIALVNALYARGFGPTGVRAVRLRPRDAATTAPVLPQRLDGAVVRLATAADADRLGVLDARLLELDAHFAGVTVRDGADTGFAAEYRARLERAPETTWVLERDGEITGYIHVMPDAESPEPDSQVLAMGGGQYLVVMYLDESERGAGLGTAFLQLAHDALDAAGAPYVLLSYAAANPRSGPFWSRSGYRPVITEWQRRPAVFAPIPAARR
ncbi:GNAT family N-acetyltransferase [Agromyces soli]|uniref:GNAT family N-acetyltransferase n=1 Tax=Agromyces soli TaxID=659012 RepID=A0ABY4AY60_9MICO|nr:GNAT family N-acetyltransferase [Agromyces soli]UOE27779.1 GNAT family N-acetyltransferase [Agromyces soli]